MKKLVMFTVLSMLLILGACSKDEVDDKQVGFSMGSIEEAAGIPKEEKEQVLAAFDKYLQTLNEQDIDGHLATLSKNVYDIGEERKYMEEQFGLYDLFYEASNVTILKYSEQEAQLYSIMTVGKKIISMDIETNTTGRQVTVFTKEDGEWKVSSVHLKPDGPTE